MKPKYSIYGIDGNAFSIMSYVSNCMKKEGKSEKEISDYRNEAMSNTYEELLCLSADIIDELNQNQSIPDEWRKLSKEVPEPNKAVVFDSDGETIDTVTYTHKGKLFVRLYPTPENKDFMGMSIELFDKNKTKWYYK